MNIAVILSAGSGVRLNSTDPKQFLLLNGNPILHYSLDKLEKHPAVDLLLVVTHPDHVQRTRDICSRFPKVVDVITGGKRRQDSVANGLEWIKRERPDCSLVLIHDSARPLFTPELIDRLIASAEKSGAVIPAISVDDTIKEKEGSSVKKTLDRSVLFRVQTPQVFEFTKIYGAYKNFPVGTDATDDAFIAEFSGIKVDIVDGEPCNIKITNPADLKLAGGMTEGMRNTVTGMGYDSHRFKAGRRLILGGVEIPHDMGLDGHSDADALLHAITDAVLGASGKRDIGHMFPDTDPKWKGADSRVLLSKAVEEVKKSGVEIKYVDAVVITERPKIGPYVEEMIKNISSAMGIASDKVNVKAKTNEKMGSIGQGEGLAAFAFVTVERDFK